MSIVFALERTNQLSLLPDKDLVDLCPPIEPYQVTKNLIELVWHSAKEYIANREFENKEELEKVVNQLLNEGELIIKWSRKLKNKGNAVNVT